MKKKKYIITAGGTSEAIDNVRKITNSSTGKLGKVIAAHIAYFQNDVDTIYYICSKDSLKPCHEKVKIIEIQNVAELKEVVENLLVTEEIDYFINAMAISDYTVNYVTNAELIKDAIDSNPGKDIVQVIKNNSLVLGGNKISSNQDNLIIVLKPTPKIISLIKKISPQTFLVGFKLLDGVTDAELIEVAFQSILVKNNCDLVVANDLDKIRKGNHKAFIIDRDRKVIEAQGKEDIASKLVRKLK